MTGPLFEVDDEFADFVRARQHQLLRAAYLLRGDEQEAERLVRGAFTTLSLRWRTVRDEDLDAFVRRVLYRDATSRRSGRRVPPAARETSAGQAPGGLLAALAELSPRQRAVTVLRHFEQRTEHDTAEALGISAHAVAAQERAARQRLHELMPPHGGDPGGLTTTDLGRWLDDASAQVEERDVVEAAREAARAHRRR
ncbi:sigma factor-like helix-turn-helix DNA-binding protein, partial [Knoellia aerolata]